MERLVYKFVKTSEAVRLNIENITRYFREDFDKFDGNLEKCNKF